MVVETNGDVRSLNRSSKLAVSAHAQYKFGQKQPNDWRNVGRPLSCNALAIDTFSSVVHKLHMHKDSY